MASSLDVSLKIQAATTGLQEIVSLINEIKTLGGDTENLDKEFARLNAEFSRLENQQTLISQFRGIEQSITNTATAFDAARAKARDLATQLSGVATPSAALKKEFFDASKQAVALQQSLSTQKDSLSQLRKQLDSAGISTGDLTSEQKKLAAQFEEVSAQVKKQGSDLTLAKNNQQEYNDALKQTGQTASGVKDLLKNLLIGVGIEESVRRITALADEYQLLAGRLKLAVEGHTTLETALSDVRKIASETYGDLGAIGKLYEKLTLQSGQLALSQKDVADITSVLAKGLKLGGASAEESSSAILQLSQALGSGVLRGEEFNSVFEASPYIMKQLADGLGVPIGEMRTLAEQGALTADIVTKALLKQRDAVDEAFGKLPLTVGNAFQLLTTNFQAYVGNADKGLGVTTALATGIKFLADNIGVLDSLLAGAAVGGIAKVIVSLESMMGSAAAATAGMTLLQRTVAILSSPLGLSAVAVGVAALISYFSSAGDSAQTLNSKLAETVKTLDKLNTAQLRGAELIAQTAIKAAQDQIKASNERIESLKNEIKFVQENTDSQDFLARAYAGIASTIRSTTAVQGLLTEEEAKAANAADELRKAQDSLATIQGKLTDQGKALVETGGKIADNYLSQVDAAKKAAAAAELTSSTLDKERSTLAALNQLREQFIAILGSETTKREAALAVENEQLDLAQKFARAKAAESTAARESLDLLTQEFSKREKLIPAKQQELDLARSNRTAKIAELQATQDQVRAIESMMAASIKLGDVNEEQLKKYKDLATTQEEQVRLADRIVKAKTDELNSVSKLSTQQQEQLNTATELVSAKKAEAVAADANARSLQIETAAMQGTIEGHRLANAAIQLTVSQLAELGRLSIQAAQNVVVLQDAQLRGKATQDEVNTVQARAVEILTAYKVALEETAKRIDERIAASIRHTTAVKTEFDVQLAQNEALIAAAKARGDETAQINLGAESKRIAAEQAVAEAAALQSELVILRERLAIQQQQVTADQEVTDAERAQLQITKDNITAKQAAVEISQAHADALSSELIAYQNVATTAKDTSAQQVAATQAIIDKSKEATDAIEKIGETTVSSAQKSTVAVQSTVAGYGELTAAGKEWADSLLKQAINSDNAASALGQYRGAVEGVRGQIQELADSEKESSDAVAALKEKFDDGKISAEELEWRIRNLTTALKDPMTQAGKSAKDALVDIGKSATKAAQDVSDAQAEITQKSAATFVTSIQDINNADFSGIFGKLDTLDQKLQVLRGRAIDLKNVL